MRAENRYPLFLIPLFRPAEAWPGDHPPAILKVNLAETLTASYGAVWIVESAMDWRDWDALGTARSREWDLGLVYEAVSTKKWWLIGLPVAACVLIAGLLCLQAPRYSAETQILVGSRTAGLIGLRSSLALFGGASGGTGPAAGQAQLIASRDLARRAIKDLRIEDNPEFDPMTQNPGPFFRALIFLGILRDPDRKSSEDRILEAYLDRLQVSTPGSGSLVTINFQSEDRELAAKAANRIAELYLEMRADASALPLNGGARIVTRAVAPAKPLYPKKALMLLSGAAMLVMAFGALVSIAEPHGRKTGRPEEPMEQPRALGQLRIFARLRDREKPKPRPGEDLALQAALTGQEDGGDGQATAKVMARILSVAYDRTVARGTRIVATSIGSAAAVSGMMRDLARDLAREGRSIVIGLDESSLFDIGRLATGSPQGGVFGTCKPPSLCDLLNGTATFAEVICRDPASRLHFLRVGRDDELNLHEFAHVLDALAETYDFLLMIAPPLDQNSIAETLAAKADFAVLAMPAGPQGFSAFEAEARLLEAGAREILLIGLPGEAPLSLGRDAA
jgi:capsular polysaccharide biosynthesis protein